MLAISFSQMMTKKETESTYLFDTPNIALHFPKESRQYVKLAALTGSRVICRPPPTDTDLDIAVYTEHKRFIEILVEEGWEYSSEGYGDSAKKWSKRDKKKGFTSLRYGHLNAIVLYSAFHFERMMFATHLATRLNLTRKQDRIDLFNDIRDWRD